MTTESTPDPIIANWAETLEGDLIVAGMDHAEAHAYRQAFELGLTRMMSVVATKQELRLGLATLRDELRREMELRFTEVDRRFTELAHRLDEAEAHNDRRFEKLEKRIDEVKSHADRRFGELEQRIDQRSDEAKRYTDQQFAELERKMDQRFDDFGKLMDARFEGQDKRLRMLVGVVALGFTINAGLLSAIIALLAQVL